MSSPGDYSELGSFAGDQTAQGGGLLPQPSYVLTTGAYDDPDWIVSLDWDKITGEPTLPTAWGLITGTLSAQTDLQTALNNKQPLNENLTWIASGITNFGLTWLSTPDAAEAITLNLGATNIGYQLFAFLANPSEESWFHVAADNTVSLQDAAETRASLEIVSYAEQSLTTAQQAQAQENIGVKPLFLSVNHTLGVTAMLAFGVSSDGISFSRLGAVNPYILPAGEGARDPSMIYHAASGKHVITYTHVTAGGDGYDDKLGLAWTKDGVTVTHITDITISGTGITVAIVWNGTILEDGGRIIFTLLPMAADTNRQTPGIGWIEVENPEDDPDDWTFSDFTAFRATNSNFTAAYSLNDVTILKVGSTYHLFCDGYTAGGPGGPGSGDAGILHATSSSWLTGYSALAYSGIASAEGAIGPVPLEEGGYRMYSQVTFAELQYSDSADLTTWSAAVEVNWPEQTGIGNGDVRRLTTLESQRIAEASPRLPFGPRLDESGYTGWTLPLQSDSLLVTARGSRTGNGDGGTPVLNITSTGTGATQKGIVSLGYITATGLLSSARLFTGTGSDTGFTADFNNTAANVYVGRGRGATTYDCIDFSRTVGTVDAGNPQYQWGIHGSEAAYTWKRYTGSTTLDLTWNTDGTFKFENAIDWDAGAKSATRTNLGLGTMAVQNAATLTASLIPNADNAIALGDGSHRWTTITSFSDITSTNGGVTGNTLNASLYFNCTAGDNTIQFYFTTGSAACPAFKRVGTAVHVRLGNDSDFAPLLADYIRASTKTVATLGSASTKGAGAMHWCSDASGSPCLAISDGTNWKRCDDMSVTVS